MFSDCTSSFAYICLSSALDTLKILCLVATVPLHETHLKGEISSKKLRDPWLFLKLRKTKPLAVFERLAHLSQTAKILPASWLPSPLLLFSSAGGMKRYVCLHLLASTAVQTVCAVGCLSFPIIVFQCWTKIGKNIDCPISHTASHAQWDIVNLFLASAILWIWALGVPHTTVHLFFRHTVQFTYRSWKKEHHRV